MYPVHEKLSFQVALNDNDDDDEQNLRISYWMIWYQLSKKLK